ncbi:hypothetical protein PsorP6_001705 [Peronosclerospora sorghi]|uniref:Uncharacterized protein n=1 Tax=Peronosclerospora sorghi TaxID=230839 RepID=A0ACC0WW63_9STRA|nr:hypothetical protein PsorP6_001705 [Peronosclerospora sorghi]
MRDAVGKRRPVRRGHKEEILYRGCLTTGMQFDANQKRKKPFTFRHGIGDVIKGMDIGIEGMNVGSKRTITIPDPIIMCWIDTGLKQKKLPDLVVYAIRSLKKMSIEINRDM